MDAAFVTHRLNDQGMAKAKNIGAEFNELLAKLAVLAPPGREFALARTHLEEACFYAKKAMAMVPENQDG